MITNTSDEVIFVTDTYSDIYNLGIRSPILDVSYELPNQCSEFTNSTNTNLGNTLLRQLIANHFNASTFRSNPYRSSVLYPYTSEEDIDDVKKTYPKFDTDPVTALSVSFHEGAHRSHSDSLRTLFDEDLNTGEKFDCSVHLNDKFIVFELKLNIERIAFIFQAPFKNAFTAQKISQMITLIVQSEHDGSVKTQHCSLLIPSALDSNWPLLYSNCEHFPDTNVQVFLKFNFKSRIDCERTKILEAYFFPVVKSRSRRQALILAGADTLGWETFRYFQDQYQSTQRIRVPKVSEYPTFSYCSS